MRKLITKMSMSIDGFVATSSGENDWIFKSSTPDSRDWAVDTMCGAGLIIMGRTSFDGMKDFWPTAGGPFAAPMNEISKGVFTQKGYKIPEGATGTWAKARVFSGDLATEIKALKQESGKPIYALGGASFMQSLIAAKLIDEYHLAIHPIALGSGLPIFSKLTKPTDLKLADSKKFSGGIVVNTYHPT